MMLYLRRCNVHTGISGEGKCDTYLWTTSSRVYNRLYRGYLELRTDETFEVEPAYHDSAPIVVFVRSAD